MKIYFNGWFSGFFEKTNPGLHVDFFLNLFEKVYGAKCFIGSLSDSNILCEFDMIIDCSSLVSSRTWQHTYLFSGESTLKCNKKNYTCVLWGERNHENVINIPLFIPYIYTNHFLDKLEGGTKDVVSIPIKDVCVVVSNPKGLVRNKFLNKLEKVMRVDYAGGYKNNITEKVIHGLLAKTIPIYWGSNRIHDYINKDRILALLQDNDDTEMDALIQQMVEIARDNNKWREIVNKYSFSSSKLERTIDIIARDISCLLGEGIGKCWNHISRIYCINNPAFEPERHIMLRKMFQDLNISDDYVSYISPTYKHTITDEIYNQNVKQQLVLHLRQLPMKKSELSLFLNYKAVLEDIVRNYKDGLFFIFESDVMLGKHNSETNNFMDFIVRKKNDLDLIHIGMNDHRIWNTPNFNDATGYENRKKYNNDKYIEDLSNYKSSFRLSRKFYTRCTDSFLWNYKGILSFLNYMTNIEINYGIPFDYYMCHFFEHHLDFKHYWSENEFFIQGSNIRLLESTIQ
jgi:hypothetical protein